MKTRILLYCGYTLFAGYEDLISKSGKENITNINKIHPLTHYFICETRRFVLLDTEIFEDCVKIKFSEQISPVKFEEHEITFPINVFGDDIISIENKFPEISLNFKTNTFVPCWATLYEFLCAVGNALADDPACKILASLLNQKIIYIGQTEIKGKYLRIDGHEKYGLAANKIVRSRPHRDLFIKLLSFDEPCWIVVEDLDAPEPGKLGKIKNAAIKLSHKKFVTLIEAALINKMQPELNIHFKKNFPSVKHKGYGFLMDNGAELGHVIVDESKRSYVTDEGANIVRTVDFEFSLNSVAGTLKSRA